METTMIPFFLEASMIRRVGGAGMHRHGWIQQELSVAKGVFLDSGLKKKGKVEVDEGRSIKVSKV